MNRYQKITAMEPEELAEFFSRFDEEICKSCAPEFCAFSDGEGNCKTPPDGACVMATLNWLLSEVSGEGAPDSECIGLPERSGASRREILLEAIKCVCTDRNEQYGEPEDNFSCIAEYWQKFLEDHCVEYGAGVCITPEDVAIMMMLFKIARYITADRPTVDTFVDIAGYAACAGEICERHRLEGER